MITRPDDAPLRARRHATALVQDRAGRMARLPPPMLAGALPTTIDLPSRTGLRRWAATFLGLGLLSLGWLLASDWNEGQFERAENESPAEYLGHLLDLALSDWLLLPLLCLAAATAFLWMHRTRQDPLRIGLSRQEARVEEAGGAWSAPIAAFSAVTLRTRAGFSIRMTNQTTTNVQRGILPGQHYSILDRKPLWWVEMVHPDPTRSLPVWASDAPDAEANGRRVAASLADRLGLPIAFPERGSGT